MASAVGDTYRKVCRPWFGGALLDCVLPAMDERASPQLGAFYSTCATLERHKAELRVLPEGGDGV